MNKKVFKWHGKFYYLLGRGVDGEMYYLEQATWDCEWYWGIGYVETFTNRRCPQASKDISSHQHFDGLFFNKGKNGYDAFKEFFAETPLSNKEIWVLLECMKSLYITRDYSDVLHRGGANYTNNPCATTITNKTEYARINKIVIPALLEKVYTTLEEN